MNNLLCQKQTPLPTNAKGLNLSFLPFHSSVTKYDPRILPCPTQAKHACQVYLIFHRKYLLLIQIFLKEFNLLAYSSGCNTLPGSETKSLA